MNLSVEQLVIIALAAVVAICVVSWLFRKDTAQEERRRGYIDLSKSLEKLGLIRLADIAEDAAIGDYSGLYKEGKALARELSNPETAMGLLAESFFKQLPSRLGRDGDREKILKVVGEFQAAAALKATL